MKVLLDNLLFPVRKEKCSIAANADCEYDIIATINDADLRLTACSERYELIPNAEIFPVIESMLDSHDIDYKKSYKMVNFSKFYVEYILTDTQLSIMDKNDIIYPRILVKHSYNGMLKYKINFGYFRLICSNGLTIPVESEKDNNLVIGGKHTISIQKSFDMLFSTLESFLKPETQIELTKTYEVLTDRWIENWGERLETVMTTNGISLKSPGSTKKGETPINDKFDFVSGIIKKEANLLYGGKVNDWLLYNGINQLINNDELNKKHVEFREELDQKVLTSLLLS